MAQHDNPSVFPLRLPAAVRRQAIELARRDGTSLNQFITIALAERIVRSQLSTLQEELTAPSAIATQPAAAERIMLRRK